MGDCLSRVSGNKSFRSEQVVNGLKTGESRKRMVINGEQLFCYNLIFN